MDFVKRIAEWYLGIPPALPGQGTAWRLQMQTPWPAWLPQWTVLLGITLLVTVVVWVYRRDAMAVAWKPRTILIALRLAVIGALGIALSGVVLSVDRTGLPYAVVLLDDSASMSCQDYYSSSRNSQRVRLLSGNRSDAGTTRMDLAKSLLTSDSGRLLKLLCHRHRLRVYRFAQTASIVGADEYTSGDSLADLTTRIEQLQATGEQTRPGPALKKALADLRGTPPAAVVLLTDGVTTTTDADRLTEVAALMKDRLPPVFAVGIGSDEPARDLALYDVLADEVAFVDDPLTFSAKLKAYGYKGRDAKVVLRARGSDAVLAEAILRIDADGQSQKVELAFTPRQTGEFDYTMTAVPLNKETNQTNNAETRHVSVRRGRLRVLLVDSVPRWEFRELKKLLERETTVELHTVLQDADLEYAAQDRTAQPLGGRVPVTQETLFAYDVIILGDVDLSFLSPRTLDMMQSFVRDAGGGMIFIAGTKHNPTEYNSTPLEPLLPVECPSSSSTESHAAATEPFHLQLTPEGREGTLLFHTMRVDDFNKNAWEQLPAFFWSHDVASVKPGARVLAVHPTRVLGEQKMPILVLQQFGAGRVLFHATDELWRWKNQTPGDWAYTGFWLRAVRHLGRGRLVGQTRTAELNSDRVVYRTGESVTLRTRFQTTDPNATSRDDVRVVLERKTADPISVLLHPLPNAVGVFEADVDHLPTGTYHAWIATPAFETAPPSTNFRIEAPRRELVERRLDRAELTAIAKMTHGRFYTIADATHMPADIPVGQPVRLESGERVRLWNRWELMLCFALLIGTEWLLRKRSRLI